jgi:DHA1 family bicyclomycin/chloramphenicol resistance-like MFS transporter
MMVGAFFMGSWLGTQMHDPVFALAHGLLLWSVFIAVVAWTLVQRHGRSAPQMPNPTPLTPLTPSASTTKP